MKVLIISAAFPPMRAGESDHCYRIAERLTESGLEVRVLTTQGNDGGSDVKFRVDPVMRDWSWKDAPRLARAVRTFAPDAVLIIYIGWIYHDHPMMTFAPTICKWAIPGVRVVALFEYFSSWRPEKWGVSTRLIRKGMEYAADRVRVDYEFGTLLRDSDAIVTLSGMHARALMSHDAEVEKKTALIPPPPLLKMAEGLPESHRDAARRELAVRPEEFLIAYFGYIYPPKGVDTLIRAFALVYKHMPEAKLILIGGVIAQEYPDWPTYAEDVKRLPGQLGIDQRVIWIGGYAAESDAPSRYLSACDACVFSHHHGVYLNNSSFAAAAAHKLPIIATRAPMVEPPFVDGHNLILCEAKNHEALAEGILRVMRDPALRARLKDGASALAQQWYSWDVATRRLLESLGRGAEHA